MTIREAYEQARAAAEKQGVPKSQCGMVAAMAVKDSMPDTLENLKALQALMAEISAARGLQRA